LFTVLPHDRGCRAQPDADTAAALVDKGALGGYAPNDIFAVNTGAILRPPRHVSLQAVQSLVLSSCRSQMCSFSRVIPEIEIWRATDLMLKRNGDKALQESAGGADELSADGDPDGAATWRRITEAVAREPDSIRTAALTDNVPAVRFFPNSTEVRKSVLRSNHLRPTN
jgi:hypothetical protein